MKKLNTKYAQHQTSSASHLCIVNSLVLSGNLSQALYFALFLKGNPAFSRHLRNQTRKKKGGPFDSNKEKPKYTNRISEKP